MTDATHCNLLVYEDLSYYTFRKMAAMTCLFGTVGTVLLNGQCILTVCASVERGMTHPTLLDYLHLVSHLSVAALSLSNPWDG